MRYDDASQAGSLANDSSPVARPDVDALAPGSFGPATGNAITGAGTTTGSSGADSVGDAPGLIVAVQGAGGPAANASGNFQANGQYGVLNMDAQGNFNYVRNAGTPDGVQDVFNYTLADNDGQTSATTLTFDIGKVGSAQAAVIPGVVNLPPGVQLSDIHVNGSDLVINMPDGTQMVIPGGAVFVPQLVIGDVQVPPSNLAALLVESEPQPGAGQLQSSGGNFASDVPPLDPGVPLGDLIPPTELVFTLPEFEPEGQDIDKEPVAGATSAQLDDDAQEGGNPGGIGDVEPTNDFVSGQLPGSDGDGSLEWGLTASGSAPTGFSFALQGNGDVWVLQGATHVMTITVDPATGDYTVDQLQALSHPAGGDENDLSFVLNYTVTDDDGDVAVGTLTINVDDDTPVVTVQHGDDSQIILTTDDAQSIPGDGTPDTAATSIDFSGVFSSTIVSPGADGAGPGTSSTYALAVTGSNSGLFSHGVAINLFVVSGVVVGSTAATSGAITDGNTVFTVSTTNTGVVTLTQFLQIDHPIADDPTATEAPFADQIISMSDGLITLTRSETVVDGDGDQVTGSSSINIGANLHFTDDGPTIGLADRGEPTLVVDETNLGTNDSASFAANFAANFGADGPAAVGGGLTYALGVSANGADSGLIDTATDNHVFLFVENGQVVGREGTDAADAASGSIVFTVSVDGTGEVSLDQVRAVVHPDGTNPDTDETVTLSADNLVTLTATATDFDGDTDSQTLNIGTNLVFHDDGPDAQTNGNGVGTVTLDETRPEGTDTSGAGAPSGDASNTINLAAGFVTGGAVDFGADGAGTVSYSLVLSANGIGSGMYAIDPNDQSASDGDGYGRGTEITLSQSGNVITGSANSVNYFTITIDPATGVATFTQLDNIWQPTPGTSYDEAAILNTALASNLQVVQTVTDADGDIDTASINLGQGVFQIQDDGPVAHNDSDTLPTGSNGPETGNVITGAGTTGGTGGAGVDDTGEDTPAHITAISGTGGTDTTFTAGLLSITGTHGTLTMDADGNYSYTRTDNVPGNLTDTFTYTLTDADGDTTTAQLVINMSDNVPSLATPDTVHLDDDVIPGFNGNTPGGTGDDPPDTVGQNVVNGQLVGSGGDGDLDYFFSASQTGLPAGFSVGAASDVDTLIIVQDQGGTPVTVLTIQLTNETGAYTVTQNANIWHPSGNDENNVPNINVSLFTQDADGDPSTPVNLTINVDDDTPTINVTKGADAAVILTTDDADTIGVNTDTATSSANFGGVFGLTQSAGADGTNTAATLAYALGVSAPGVDSGLNQGGVDIHLYLIGGVVVGSTATTVGNVNSGNTVFNVSVSNTGVVTLNQFSQIDHPIADDPSATGTPFNDQFISMADGLITLTASASITDKDGDTATDQEVVSIGANLHFTDDGPDVAAALTGTQIRIDETDGVVAAGGEVDPVGGNLGTVTMTLASLVNVTNPHVSADSPTTNVYSLALSSQGVDSGLDVSSNNASIFLYNMGGGVIAGSTSATLGGVNAGNTAFTISINSGTGAVTMTQFLAIEHSNTASVDEDSAGIAAGALSLVVTATDFDGDTDAASVDLGSVVRFEDDGPTLGTIQDGTANNNPAAAHSFGSLFFASGSDSPGDVTNITTSDLTGITSGNKALVTHYDDATRTLTAFQDANGNNIYDALTDTTVVFTLTVNPTGGPNGGTWDFDLVTAIDPTVTEVAISGSSSFGAGPTLGQILTDGASPTPHAMAVVSGYHPTASFDVAAWMSGTPLSGTTDTSTGVNGSTAGWGVDNNNFETNSGGTLPDQEIMFFDFGAQALSDPDSGGAFTPPPVSLPDITFAKFDFIGYKSGAANAGDDIAYVVHFTDGSSASGWVPDPNIDGATWIFNAPAGKFIADISFYSGIEPDGSTVQDLGPGKIDLVSVGTTTSNLNKSFDFTVSLTDADGDPVSGSFTMNIANGNSPSVASPVVLDLNGDGVHFLSLAAGVHYDYGDGSVATAWASPEDGILIHDANGNGTVDNASEFVFGSGGISDLQGLAAYDTNHDGQLSSADAAFSSFGVWQDANSNGRVDAGEYQTLAAMGINSISLSSDGIQYSAANGDVDVVGTGSYTTTDGSTHALADAAFHFGSRSTEDLRSSTAISGNTNILAAALAAAGLAASEPLAAEGNHVSLESLVASSGGEVHPAALAPIAVDSVNDPSSSGLLDQPGAGNGSATPESSHGNSHSTDSAGHDTAAGHSTDVQAPAALPQGTDSPANDAGDAPALTASAITMPSAEQLAAAGLGGQPQSVAGQHNEVVGKVLADALHGGGQGPNVDALINSLPGHGDGGNAVADALASHAAGAVPNGDTSIFASFSGGLGSHMMEHMAMHADAAPAHA